MRLHIKKNK